MATDDCRIITNDRIRRNIGLDIGETERKKSNLYCRNSAKSFQYWSELRASSDLETCKLKEFHSLTANAKRLVHPTNTTKAEMKGNSSLLSLFEGGETDDSHFSLEVAACKARESTRLFNEANTRIFSWKAFCCWLITDSSAWNSTPITAASVTSARGFERKLITTWPGPRNLTSEAPFQPFYFFSGFKQSHRLEWPSPQHVDRYSGHACMTSNIDFVVIFSWISTWDCEDFFFTSGTIKPAQEMVAVMSTL